MNTQLGKKCFIWKTVTHERSETIRKLKENEYIVRTQTNKMRISESKHYKMLTIA